jgi:nucleotide-binding universal stress UspA family protein
MKILLAIDTSAFADAAVQAVIEQFSPRGNEVRVFHAGEWLQHLPLSYFFAQGPEAATAVMSAKDEILRAADEHVREMATRLRAAHFAVTTEIVPEGDPRTAILDAAEKWPADLIVVGSHGRSGLDRFLLGSVSERVVRHAPCSVEVVRLSPSRAA